MTPARVRPRNSPPKLSERELSELLAIFHKTSKSPLSKPVSISIFAEFSELLALTAWIGEGAGDVGSHRRRTEEVAVSVTSPSPTLAPRALRHRRSVRRLTSGQLGDLREAVAAAQGIADDRGYQRWAGIHGLPLPISCTHHSELFLPWHRAYLYLFEKALQERVPASPSPGGTGPPTTAKGSPRPTPAAARTAKRIPSSTLRSSPPGAKARARRAPSARREGPGRCPPPARSRRSSAIATSSPSRPNWRASTTASTSGWGERWKASRPLPTTRSSGRTTA